jgi:mRNA-degrading endonuclease RelE of RelBE toxin-antitoxin system
MTFKSIVTGHFSKKYAKLTGKNDSFKQQIVNKMKGIRQNPEIGIPKSHNLRGLRGLHITEHFVIVYLIFKDYVIFINLDHHDKAYDAAEGLIDRILEDDRLLTELGRAKISTEEFAQFIRTVGKR